MTDLFKRKVPVKRKPVKEKEIYLETVYVDCRDSDCKKKVKVEVWPGDKPNKYQHCPDHKRKFAA